MSRVIVIVGGRSLGPALIRILADRLRDKGCEVCIVDEVQRRSLPKPEVTFNFDTYANDCAAALEVPVTSLWGHRRDYPTLKQGLRNPAFKKKTR